MRKWMKAAAVAAALSMLVSMEALAVVSPSGTPIDDGDSGSGTSESTGETGNNPAQEIYDEVVTIGEDGVPMVSPDASEELLEIFQEYYEIDENGVPMAKTPETETSPKTGEGNSLILVSGVGVLSLAGALVLLKKERKAEA